METCIFVYGSLRRGFDNTYARLLHDNAAFIGTARMRGRKLHCGEYPGMKPALNDEDWVEGELFQMRDPQATLRALDHYEGPEYAREMQTAYLADGSARTCWVYLYLL